MISNLDKLKYHKIVKQHIHKYTHIFMNRNGRIQGITSLLTPTKSPIFDLTNYNSYWLTDGSNITTLAHLNNNPSPEDLQNSLTTNNKLIEQYKQLIAKRISQTLSKS